MANVKISDLTAAASASATQQFEVNESGTSKRVTGSQVAAYTLSTMDSGDVSAAGGALTANNLSDLANAGTARTNLGLGSIATQNSTSVNIDGGAIDGTPIGASSASTGSFTTLAISSSVSGNAIATQAEAQAGTNNDQIMTPLRVSQAIAALAGGELTAVSTQTFNSSGTWTKPSSGTIAIIEVWGAGGSGGGGSNHSSGGGGGGYGTLTLPLSKLSSSYSVTVGAGGAGLTTRNSVAKDGNQGGSSSFGTILSVSGGSGGGTDGTAEVNSLGGSWSEDSGIYRGGYGGGSNTSQPGRAGESVLFGGGGGGGSYSIYGGAGGTSVAGGNGGAGNAGDNQPNGGPGQTPGGGGGACGRYEGGGSGGNGRVIVTVY